MKCTRFPLIFLIITLSGCASSPYTSQDTHLVNESLKEIQNGNYEQAEADLLVALGCISTRIIPFCFVPWASSMRRQDGWKTHGQCMRKHLLWSPTLLPRK